MPGDLVLITGATGMIGFRTLVELLHAGYRARIAVRKEADFGKIKSLKPMAAFLSNVESVVVPDITAPGAYDDAVKGVKYVIHVASPLAHPRYNDTDYEAELIQPAIKGTVGMLESANKESLVQKVVITASVASKAVTSLGNGETIDEDTNTATTKGPYATLMAAYGASKALSYQATLKFMQDKKPAFDVVNIRPVFVLGRDDTVTVPTEIAKGTNGFLMGPILGHAREFPLPGSVVHVDDVAKMHVLSLDPKIKGVEDFLASAHPEEGIQWADAFDIIKKHYPEQCKAGIFKVGDDVPRPPTVISRVANAKASEAFDLTFKTFEEQVTSVAEHFLELIGRR
ncbi:hypothetical protein NQ176_g1994 [Zarea fungicola]|uniref:Uncharacterized protein n=1 Tax=Zarea fungicola TaxID=93591 RepID=A0ACC1NRJ7_9HYPO|nr:hypothetical protein NQ176_g1994 [Lecanicillium fungicola]